MSASRLSLTALRVVFYTSLRSLRWKEGNIDSKRITRPPQPKSKFLFLAQAIFEKFLGISELPCSCSCSSRAGTLSVQRRAFSDVNLIIDDIEVSRGEEIAVPIIINNPFNINAFGFDLLFSSQILEFVRVERTELLKDFPQVEGNEIAKGILRIGGYSSEPIESQSSGVLIVVIFRVISEPEEPSTFMIINSVDDVENAAVRTGMITKKIKRK